MICIDCRKSRLSVTNVAMDGAPQVAYPAMVSPDDALESLSTPLDRMVEGCCELVIDIAAFPPKAPGSKAFSLTYSPLLSLAERL